MKNINGVDAEVIQSMFVLTILEKILRKEFYEKKRVELTNTQINKLKSAAKNKTGKTLRITKKNFQVQELLNKLFLLTRQTTKIRRAIATNTLANIKLSKDQLSKIIKSDGVLDKMLDNFNKTVLLDLTVPLAKDILPKLATRATSSVSDKF